MGLLSDACEILSKAGWSLGYVSAGDCEWRTIWIADAHRDEKRFVVRADERLTAFLELESAIRLVFVDCQLGVKEGKMKGSTKSQKMDEPFSF
jgi:hypothetical protein